MNKEGRSTREGASSLVSYIFNYFSEEDMAAEITNYPPGTVTHLYLTSDGGLNLPMLYRMIEMLGDHVKVVNHEELTEMARQRTLSMS